jgi:quercetin dioxygenase-like cupin family protein
MRTSALKLRWMLGVCAALILTVANPALVSAQVIPCKDQQERTGDVGCWVLVDRSIGRANTSQLYWHIDSVPQSAAGSAPTASDATLVRALGSTWSFTIERRAQHTHRGIHVASIGPLIVKPGRSYTARFMESVFEPGMMAGEHRHPGPEAWYTLSGAICLETPTGTAIGRAGEGTIIPEGPPMHLTAIGTEKRRSLVLILHDSTQPAATSAGSWKSTNACRR